MFSHLWRVSLWVDPCKRTLSLQGLWVWGFLYPKPSKDLGNLTMALKALSHSVF